MVISGLLEECCILQFMCFYLFINLVNPDYNVMGFVN